MARLYVGLSVVAVILALMGLAGIVSYTAYSRQKEIGIRKVLGASAPNIFAVLSRDFVKLMVFANLLGWPLHWRPNGRRFVRFAAW